MLDACGASVVRRAAGGARSEREARLRDDHEAVGEQAYGVVAFARRDGEGGFDPACGGREEGLVLRLLAGADHVAEGVEPEGAFERALRVERAVYAVGDDALGSADDLSRRDERGVAPCCQRRGKA